MKNRLNKIKIYFLGSGKIAVPVVDRLYNSDSIDLVGVGTQADSPTGRKKKLKPTPVGAWAEKNNIKIDKPQSVNKLEFSDKVKLLSPDFIFVLSFGQILKKRLLALPKVCCINVHASLLPLYRGASPLTAPLLNGDEKTGITFMKMERGLDSGPAFLTINYPLNEAINTEYLEMELGKLAANYAVDIVNKVYDKELMPIEQDHDNASFVGKIVKNDGLIDWTMSAVLIERMVRAYYPWPGAFFYLKKSDRLIKIQIVSAEVCVDISENPGDVVKADKKQWVVACGEYCIEIKRLIPEGKKEMSGADFIRGCKPMTGCNICTNRE